MAELAVFQDINREITERLEGLDGINLDDLGQLNQAFPDIATEVLQNAAFNGDVDVAEIVGWVCGQDSLTSQRTLELAFGQPALCLYKAAHFYLELLFWFPSRTAIHSHNFTGAFRVLQGCSLQIEYDYRVEEEVCHHVYFGDLRPRRIDLLSPSDVYAIRRHDDLVHTVAHMGNPSLTLVARTYLASKTVPQLNYYRNGLAIDTFRNQISLHRQAMALEVLSKAGHPDFRTLLLQFLQRGDFNRYFQTVMNLSHLINQELKEEVLAVADPLWGTYGEKVFEVLEDNRRTKQFWASVPRFSDPRKHLDLALTELFHSREDLIWLMEACYPGRESESLFEEWQEKMELFFASGFCRAI